MAKPLGLPDHDGGAVDVHVEELHVQDDKAGAAVRRRRARRWAL